MHGALAIPVSVPSSLELPPDCASGGIPFSFTVKKGNGFTGDMKLPEKVLPSGRTINPTRVTVTNSNCPVSYTKHVSTDGQFISRRLAHGAVILLAVQTLFGDLIQSASRAYNIGDCYLSRLEISGMPPFENTDERIEAARYYYKIMSKFATINLQFCATMQYLFKLCCWNASTPPPSLALDLGSIHSSLNGVSSSCRGLLAVQYYFLSFNLFPGDQRSGPHKVLTIQQALVEAAELSKSDAAAREALAAKAAAEQAKKRSAEEQEACIAKVNWHQNAYIISVIAIAAAERTARLFASSRRGGKGHGCSGGDSGEKGQGGGGQSSSRDRAEGSGNEANGKREESEDEEDALNAGAAKRKGHLLPTSSSGDKGQGGGGLSGSGGFGRDRAEGSGSEANGKGEESEDAEAYIAPIPVDNGISFADPAHVSTRSPGGQSPSF